MSKDTGTFTKSLVESNEIFAEAIRLLQEQIKKVTLRLEGLEKDLSIARSQLKNKNVEILRLKEIIKTYEEDQKRVVSENDQMTNNELLTQIKDLSATIKTFQSSMSAKSQSESNRDDKEHYEYEEVEVEDEEFNSLVEELDTKKLEIQSILQEKEDLLEEGQVLKDKIVHLENTIEELSETQISQSLKELQYSYDSLQDRNNLLEEKVHTLEEELEKAIPEESKEDEQVSSLKNEVSKYIQQNEEITSYKEKIEQLEEEAKQLRLNLETSQTNLLKIQEENQSLETKIDRIVKDNFDLKNDITSLTKQVNEKEEELLNLKLKGNQLEEKEDINSVFNLDRLEIKEDAQDSNQDELLLKISEMEMEEANWQDEKRILLSTIENLKTSLQNAKKVSDQQNSEFRDSSQLNLINSLKSEISELNHDLDEADSELKELELENGVLRDRIAELEERDQIEVTETTVQPNSITQVKDENTKLTYELKEKNTQLEELTVRIQSQEQKISHLENLMEQEHELKEKFEYLFTNLKNKLEQKEIKREKDNINAKKQLEQVVRSLNLSDEVMPLTAAEDDDEETEAIEGGELDDSSSEVLGKALENANLYLDLVDKFLKPHVQITQLLKQGMWDIDSLIDIIGIERKKLLEILRELSEKQILQFDETKVWLVSD